MTPWTRWGLRPQTPILVALALTLAAVTARGADDPVIARRGADQVTESQARALFASLDPDTRAKLAANPQAEIQLLRDLLLQRAILAQASAEKWADRQDVAAQIAKTRDQVIAQTFLAAHAAPPAGYPSESEIQSAYETNKQRFLLPRQYHLEQIFTPVGTGGPPSQDAAKRTLAQLRATIARSRTPFEDAAKRDKTLTYADLGWLPENRIAEPVKATIAGLPEGTVSDPVCTPSGCHLLKLVATKPAGPAPLAAIHDQLVRALRQQKQQDLERDYANRLLTQTPVQVNELALSHLATP